MLIKMIQNLRNRMEKIQEKFNKDLWRTVWRFLKK